MLNTLGACNTAQNSASRRPKRVMAVRDILAGVGSADDGEEGLGVAGLVGAPDAVDDLALVREVTIFLWNSRHTAPRIL